MLLPPPLPLIHPPPTPRATEMQFENFSTEELLGELRRRVRCAEKTTKTTAIFVRQVPCCAEPSSRDERRGGGGD